MMMKRTAMTTMMMVMTKVAMLLWSRRDGATRPERAHRARDGSFLGCTKAGKIGAKV